MTGQEELKRLSLPPQLAGLILTVVEEMGISPDDVLSGSGIRPASLHHDDTHLSFQQMFKLIDNALRLTKAPWLGLIIGNRENISTWGVLGYAMMSCATHREALEVGQRFHRAAASLMGLTTEQDGEQIRVNLEPLVPMGSLLPFCVEETINGIFTVYSNLCNNSARPLEVRLSYSKPNYAARLEWAFQCPIHYEQPRNAFLLNAPSDIPLQHADPFSAKICLALVEQMLQRHGYEDDFLMKVRQILLRSPGIFPDLEGVAEELNMSSRNVRRKLKQHDTSFKAVLMHVKSNLAIDYLQNSNLTLDKIAAFLGYTESTNFRRAFKQWTGRAPSYYRSQFIPAPR